MAQPIDYIDESKDNDGAVPFFKLSDLIEFYTERLQSLGVDSKSQLRSTTLKNRILAHFPDLQSHNSGRGSLLGFKEAIGPALQKACEKDYDRKPLHIQKAAKLIREDILARHQSLKDVFTRMSRTTNATIAVDSCEYDIARTKHQ